MELIIEILFNILLGLLGIIFLTIFNAKDYIMNKDKTFVFSTHFKQNKWRWIWSFLMVVIVAILIGTEPKTAEGIKTFTGLDISGERASFFTLGLALTAMIKRKK